MSGQGFVWQIAAIMSGNRTSNKATRRQVNKYIDKQLHNNAKRLLRHVLPHRGHHPISIRNPTTQLDSTPFPFAFISLLLWGVFVVVVDSCGCVKFARNKYGHHVNSLAHAQWSMQHANQTQI